MKQTLSNFDLQRTWVNWVNTFSHDYPDENRGKSPSYWTKVKYDRLYRWDELPLKFEDWLMAHGAYVKSSSGKRYLEFCTPEQATWFILKWL